MRVPSRALRYKSAVVACTCGHGGSSTNSTDSINCSIILWRTCAAAALSALGLFRLVSTDDSGGGDNGSCVVVMLGAPARRSWKGHDTRAWFHGSVIYSCVSGFVPMTMTTTATLPNGRITFTLCACVFVLCVRVTFTMD